MTAPSLKIFVVQGTIRDGRSSIHPARYVTDRFRENGYDAELFDMKEYDIPLFTNRRDAISDPHPDVDAFGEKVEAADALVIVAPEYNHSIPGTLKNLLDHLYPDSWCTGERDRRTWRDVSRRWYAAGGGSSRVCSRSRVHRTTDRIRP